VHEAHREPDCWASPGKKAFEGNLLLILLRPLSQLLEIIRLNPFETACLPATWG
jgi:hypothetical protein